MTFRQFRVLIRLVRRQRTDQSVGLGGLFFTRIVGVFRRHAWEIAIYDSSRTLATLRAQRGDFVPMESRTIGNRHRTFHRQRFFFTRFHMAQVIAQVALVVFDRFQQDRYGAAAPLFRLLITVLFDDFHFIRALRHAMIAFIRFPKFLGKRPYLVRFIRRVPRNVSDTFRRENMDGIGTMAFLFRRLAYYFYFTCTFLERVRIMPANRAIFFIPLAFTVAGRGRLDCDRVLAPRVVFW